MKLIVTEAQAAYIIKEEGGKVFSSIGNRLSTAGANISQKASEKAANVVTDVGPEVANWASKQQISNVPGGMSDEMAARFNDIDIEKTAPNFYKFVNSWKEAGNVDNLINMVKPSTNVEIPKGSEMMSPLGRKVKIKSPFGRRRSPTAGATSNHGGIDLEAQTGSPVYAPLDGIIVRAEDTKPNGCGGHIKIKHNKNLETKYCHLKKWVVKKDQKVKKGELIGYSGGDKNDPYHGVSTGAHLHYATVVNGSEVDPLTVHPNLA